MREKTGTGLQVWLQISSRRSRSSSIQFNGLARFLTLKGTEVVHQKVPFYQL